MSVALRDGGERVFGHEYFVELEIMLLPLQFAWISIGVPSPVMTLPVKVFDDDPDMSRTPVEAEPFIEIVLNERVLRLAPV
jgi:hypothetical protein